jgi:DNA repair protein SbcC/Rad50
MILNALRLENYKQYAELDLEFREGLVGIIGKNGAGKSTLFEAVLYCLFGKDESDKNLIRSAFADPKANVLLELRFTIGAVQYTVRREFRGKIMAPNAELFKNDEQIAKGASAVTEEVVKLLNMERDTFKQTVFSGQKELSELSDTTGEARKRMVRKMLGLEALDDIQKKINTDVNNLENQLKGQRGNLLGETQIAEIEADIAESRDVLLKKEQALAAAGEQLQAVQNEYTRQKQLFETEEYRLRTFNRLQSEQGRAHERGEGLQRQLDELALKKSQLEARRTALEVLRPDMARHETQKAALLELDAQHKRLIALQNLRAQLDASYNVEAKTRETLFQYQTALAEREQTEAGLREKNDNIAVLDGQIGEQRKSVQALSDRISGLNAAVQDRRQKVQDIVALGRDGACPTCHQPLTGAYESTLQQLNEELEALQSDVLENLRRERNAAESATRELAAARDRFYRERDTLLGEKARLDELQKQATREEAQLRQLEQTIDRQEAAVRDFGTVDFDEVQYADLQTTIKSDSARYEQFKRDDNYVRIELPQVERGLEEGARGLEENAVRQRQFASELAALQFDPEQYEQAKAAFLGFDQRLNAQTQLLRDLERAVLGIRHNIERAGERLSANERIKTQISGKAAEVELLDKLAKLLGEFKTEILEKVSPAISHGAGQLFSRITKGKYESIRVDDNFDFGIADGGRFYPIKRFSGGEIDLANFCLRIAVSKAIMELSGSGQNVEFLAFDEIFGSQDEERRYEIMLALNYLKEQFRQIYIVSHIDSLRDYFPNLLEVKVEAGAGSSAGWL